MQTLNYNRNRLLLGAAAALFAGLVFVLLITNPGLVSGRRAMRLIGNDFGRLFLVPLMAIVSLAAGWRFAVTALGHGRALEASGGDLLVHTLWGPKRFRAGELRSATLKNVTGQAHLIFRGGKGGLFGEKKAGLVLGLTELHPSRFGELAESIERLRAAPGVPAAARAPALDPAAAASSGFDADQALARYLARKAEGGVSPDPVPTLAQAPRPVFGRKRV